MNPFAFLHSESRPRALGALLTIVPAMSLAACGDDAADELLELDGGGLADGSDDASSEADVSADLRIVDAAGEEGSALGSADAYDAASEPIPDANFTPEVAVDARPDCGAPGVLHQPPALPDSLAVPPGVRLVAGYRAFGSVFYACQAAPADGGGVWLSAPSATLYGDDCTAVATYSFVSGNPTWTALSGTSSVTARVDAVLWVSGDSGSPTELPWLRFVSTMNPGAGILQNITYVQQVDTSGGLKPPMPCDPRSDAGKTVSLPYSATYYFYTGVPTPRSNDASSPPIASDARSADAVAEISPVTPDAGADALDEAAPAGDVGSDGSGLVPDL